jgi:hypothetical protein
MEYELSLSHHRANKIHQLHFPVQVQMKSLLHCGDVQPSGLQQMAMKTIRHNIKELNEEGDKDNKTEIETLDHTHTQTLASSRTATGDGRTLSAASSEYVCVSSSIDHLTIQHIHRKRRNT